MGEQKDTVPSIEGQGYSHTPIDNDTICGVGNAKFNGSYIIYKGRKLFAYRGYHPDHGRRCVFMVEFNDDMSVKWCKPLNLYSKFPKADQEDCRLWVHKDRLWISYCDVAHIAPHWVCLIQVCRLDHDNDFKVDQIIPMIEYGNNKMGGVEKNWIFFSHEDELYLIYSTGDHQVMKINDKTGRILETYNNRAMWWPYGHIRGGTPPIRMGDEYLAFFHGSDYKAWLGRRYFLAPYTFEAKPPFAIKRFSKTPMIYGSREDPFCGSGSGQCIFPMGLIEDGDKYLVSCGVNDTFNTIVEIPKNKTEEYLEPESNFRHAQMWHFFSDKATKIPSPDGHQRHWTVFRSTAAGRWGAFKTDNPMVICELVNRGNTERITQEDYDKLISLDPDTYHKYIGAYPSASMRRIKNESRDTSGSIYSNKGT